MLTKVLIFLGVLVGVFIVARMGAASAARAPGLRFGRKRKSATVGKRAEDMIACPTCGAFRAKGDPCPCSETPTL